MTNDRTNDGKEQKIEKKRDEMNIQGDRLHDQTRKFMAVVFA